MKSFKHQTKSFDENARIKSKSNTSAKLISKNSNNNNANNITSSIDKREALGDLTQLNENRKIDLNLKTSLQKVHIYKQKHQKRPHEELGTKTELGTNEHYDNSQNSDDVLKFHFDRLGGSSDVSNLEDIGFEFANQNRIVEQFDDDEEEIVHVDPEVDEERRRRRRRRRRGRGRLQQANGTKMEQSYIQ